MLRIDDVTKDFGAKRVLEHVHTEVPSHSVTFLMGPNGAGKTTLLRCILGLYRFDGAITWDGRPLDPAEHRVCPVFDDAPFHPRLTGAQNLKVLAPESRHGPVQYLTDEVLFRKVKHYSHGERMRLALMAALNSGSELVLLDEPTNGLDRDTMRRLKTDMRRLTETMTFLVTGHNLEFYEDVVDNVLILEDGTVGAPPPEEPTEGARLARLYDQHYPTATG